MTEIKDKAAAIRQALSDPGCESVTVEFANYDDIFLRGSTSETFWIEKGDHSIDLDMHHPPMFDDFMSECHKQIEIKSFTINHATYPDIGVGDYVSVFIEHHEGDGNPRNIGCGTLKYCNVINNCGIDMDDGTTAWASRHELVLLQKAEVSDNE